MTNDQPARPAARYGKAKPAGGRNVGGKAMAVILLVILVALIVAIARFLVQREEITVSANMTDFERIDDSHIAMTFDVTRDDVNQPSYCIVRALNYELAEVGRREVLIPAGGEQAQRMTTEIPTRDVPVSVGVYGCSTVIPHYMDLPGAR